MIIPLKDNQCATIIIGMGTCAFINSQWVHDHSLQRHCVRSKYNLSGLYHFAQHDMSDDVRIV